MRRLVAASAVLLSLAATGVSTALVAPASAPAAASGVENSIKAPDPDSGALWHTSLALDAAGYPVIAYYDGDNNRLKLVHCNDPNCAGGDESVEVVDSFGDPGLYNSMVLDGSGNPVISYHDAALGDLRVAHCADPNCSAGTSVIAVDQTMLTGLYTSIQLDASGNPVVSYQELSRGRLKIAHCNDPDCAGGDESIVETDVDGAVGSFTSLELNSSGFPVVSYMRFTDTELRLLRCGNANCNSGAEIISVLDSAGDVGSYTQLELDAFDVPTISYYDATNGDLKVLRCDEFGCAGLGETITVVDAAGDVGKMNSMQLDVSAGRSSATTTRRTSA